MRQIILIILFLSFQWKCFSQSDYNQQLEKAAISIAEKIKFAGKKSVAVLDFENSNKQISELGGWLSGVFTTHLENNSGGAFSVKNNTDVVKAIQQIKTESGSGAFDSRSIQRLGEISGSDVVIYAIITLMDDQITVNIKAVNPSAGNPTPIGGTLVNFNATEGMRTKYDNYIEDKTATTSGGQNNNSTASSEGTARTCKNPNCKEEKTGDYCFQNNTSKKLTVKMVQNYRYWPDITLDPNQAQCVYNKPAGAFTYEIFESQYGGRVTYTAPGHAQPFWDTGEKYIEQCKSVTFIIR
jgi:hypothetical protein